MPAPVTVRLLAVTDAPLLETAAADVFDLPVDPRLTAQFLADPRHHIAAALAECRVVGMATAVHYVHPDKPPELWINEVGVSEPYQRQGIARRMLDTLFQHARTLGCAQAWVLTESGNTPARALYAATGGREDAVVGFTFEIGKGD